MWVNMFPLYISEVAAEAGSRSRVSHSYIAVLCVGYRCQYTIYGPAT